MLWCWCVCFGSDGEFDLWGVCLFFEVYYLWLLGGLVGSFISFFVSKVVCSWVEQVKGEDLFLVLCDKGFKGKVYCFMEIVFDVFDLICCLVELVGDSLFVGECIELLCEGWELVGLCVDGWEICVQCVVFSVGVGNEVLFCELGLE